MRIEEIYVDGFGLIQGKSLAPTPGLTLIRGLNEAGKTTLLAFVRAILFGFDTRRYAAMAGGRRGGRLTVRMADERVFKIERYGDRGGQGTLKVVGEDGRDRGADELTRLLQGVDGQLFRNVFAFGLAELAAFENLKGQEISARIYGAGLGLGSVSAVDTEGRFGIGAGALFKSGGSAPVINGILRELEEVDARIRSRDLPAEHADTVGRLKETEAQRDEIAERIRAKGEEMRRHDRHCKAWWSWIDLRDAIAAREALGDVPPLPGDLAEALARLETRSQEAADGLVRADEAVARHAEAMGQIHVDTAVLAHRDALDELGRDAIRDRERRKELDGVMRDVDAADRELAAALGRLGADWTEERVEAFDDSLGVETAITGRFRELLDRAAVGVANATSAHAEIERGLAVLDADVAALDEQVAAIREEEAALPPVELQERRVRDLDAAIAMREHAADVATHATEAADVAEASIPPSPARLPWADLAREAASLRDAITQDEFLESVATSIQVPVAPVEPTSAAAPSPLPWPALVIGMVALIGATILFVLNVPLLAAGALVAGLAAAVFVWRQGLSAAPSIGVGSDAAAASAAVAAKAAAELDERRLRVRDRRVALAASVGLASDADTAVVDALLGSCATAARLAEQADLLRAAATREAEAAASAAKAVATAAKAAGLPEQPSIDDLVVAMEHLTAARDRAARRQGLVAQADAMRARRDGRSKELSAAEVKASEARTSAEAAHSEWATWLSEHGLDPSLDRETAARMVDAVTTAKQPLRKRAISRERAAALRGARGTFVAAGVSLAEQIGHPSAGVSADDQPALERLLAELEKAHVTAVTAAAEHGEAQRTLDRLGAAAVVAEEACAAAEQDLQNLLAEHGAGDPSALRERIVLGEETRRLDDVIAAATSALQTLSGPGTALDRLRDELAAIGDVSEAETGYAESRSDLDGLEVEQAGLHEAIGELRDAVDRMEHDAAGAADRQLKENLLARLDAQSRAWATFTVARHVLARARNAYEAEHRPAVLKTAETYFREWTARRYQRILAPIGSQAEAVEHQDGSNVPIDDLSTGTAQQLYLAIRFGLLEHFAQNAEPLPIVMDDILVNFDNERAALAARSIEELAKRQQVLYFTCHPEVPLTADVTLELPRLRTVADAMGGSGA